MPRRQARSLPSLFLMTDERMGDGLWPALQRLPRGGAIIFRHYHLPPVERRMLFDQVRRIARKRRLMLLLAGTEQEAVAWRADGVHGLSSYRRMLRPMLRTAPAHDRAQWVSGLRAGQDLMLVSPLFATRSHPDAPVLGPLRAGLMLGADRRKAVALGGVTASRARALRALGIRRWAAIDAWL